MKTATVKRVDTALRDEWLDTVAVLEDQIAGWARQEAASCRELVNRNLQTAI